MTHRYYIKNSVPTFQPTLKGAWDTSAAVVYRELGIQDGPIGTAAQAETSTNTAWDMALLCLVCRFAIGGTLPITDPNPIIYSLFARLASATSSFVGHNHWWISQGATSTVRNTILTDGIGAANWLATPEFRFSFASLLSTVAVTAGDHLVIELGARGITSSATSRTATLHYGGLGGPDPVDTTAMTTQSGWVDFYPGAEELMPRLPVSGTPLLMAA